MKKIFLVLSILVSAIAFSQTGTDSKMHLFVSSLMKKMTISEKIGQLNLLTPGGDVNTTSGRHMRMWLTRWASSRSSPAPSLVRFHNSTTSSPESRRAAAREGKRQAAAAALPPASVTASWVLCGMNVDWGDGVSRSCRFRISMAAR